MNLRKMTNATKAQLIVAINGLLLLAVAFEVALTETQIAAIGAAVNGVLSLFVASTYQDSAARDPEFDSEGV